MNNIFERAKFGDKFVNRVGKIFIFQKIDSNNYATLFSENSVWSCPLDGKNGVVENEFDIIGKYQEPIDEKKLDEFAKIESPYDEEDFAERNQYYHPAFIEGFKAGYRKVMEK